MASKEQFERNITTLACSSPKSSSSTSSSEKGVEGMILLGDFLLTTSSVSQTAVARANTSSLFMTLLMCQMTSPKTTLPETALTFLTLFI